MFHRTIYRLHNGPIPDGFEVDHMCKRRACCSPEHLQLLEGTSHAVKSNRERYADRKADAKRWWLKHRTKGVVLATYAKVSFAAACGWIREWKRNE